jgi:hypothetical protein
MIETIVYGILEQPLQCFSQLVALVRAEQVNHAIRNVVCNCFLFVMCLGRQLLEHSIISKSMPRPANVGASIKSSSSSASGTKHSMSSRHTGPAAVSTLRLSTTVSLQYRITPPAARTCFGGSSGIEATRLSTSLSSFYTVRSTTSTSHPVSRQKGISSTPFSSTVQPRGPVVWIRRFTLSPLCARFSASCLVSPDFCSSVAVGQSLTQCGPFQTRQPVLGGSRGVLLSTPSPLQHQSCARSPPFPLAGVSVLFLLIVLV